MYCISGVMTADMFKKQLPVKQFENLLQLAVIAEFAS